MTHKDKKWPLNREKYTDTDGETKNREVTCSKTTQVRVQEKCKTIFNLLLHVVELMIPKKLPVQFE